MTWHDYTDEHLLQAVQNSSPELLAHHLRAGDRALAEQAERHAQEMTSLRAALSRAERAGLACMRAERAGRRTVRLADVLPPVQGND